MLYKKNLFFAVFATLFLASCDLDLSLTTEADSSATSSTTASTVSWNASQSDIFEFSADVTTVNISNATSGKTLYFVRRNTGSQTISSKNIRTLTAASQRQADSDVSEDFLEFDEEIPNLQKGFAGCFIPEQIDLKNYSSSARSASVSYETAISGKVGETKEIYVDNNTDISTFVQKSATLRAVGTYCYVWVVDDFYSSTAGKNKVDSAIAQEYADAFDKMYPMITNAVNSLNGKNYTYDDLFEKYLLALFGDSTYTHNKDADCTLQYNSGDYSSAPYEYPMTAYNIFDSEYSFSVNGEEYCGPAIFNYNEKSVELRPENGVLIHGIGTFSGSSVSVSFSSGTSAEKIYLIIK